jgi:hypothetical protein
MKHLLFSIMSAMHLLQVSQFGDACAAGSFDGEWIGSARSTIAQCKPANVTLIVQGKDVTGQARFEVDAPKINGTVSEDGTFGATIGWQPFTGKFSQDGFEGTFKNGNCVWKILLQRGRSKP